MQNIIKNNTLSGVQNMGKTANGGSQLAPVRSLADCANLLRTVGARAAVLELTQLQAFWLSIMADKTNSTAQRLQASKYYADSIGGFAASAGVGPGATRVRWGTVEPVDVVVSDE